MSLDPPWAVLAPGNPAWITRHALAALGLDEEDAFRDEEVEFEIVPGGSHYHAIIGPAEAIGNEGTIAKYLSLKCTEPVYSIMGSDVEEPALVYMYENGVEKMVDVEPQELARFLGCPFPEPPPIELEPPLKTVALVEGVPVQEALRALEELERAGGFPPPQESFRLVEIPRGLLIAPGAARLNGTHIHLAGRLPQATVYGVTATPNLDAFFVSVYRGEEEEDFAEPPDQAPEPPTLTEIKGERSPERILAALGIPPEWFQQ